MAKLYQRQNVQLQRGQIYQPDKKPSIGAAIANFGAAALDKIAKDNFALGHANLVNSIITTAYESNPTDLKRFNEMVESGILKSTKNLPGDMARKIRSDAETKALALNKQIKSNMIKAANAELQNKTQTAVDDITGNGPMGMRSLNDSMMESFINRDEEGAAATRQLWNLQHQRLSNLAEVKNASGDFVIGKETERNMYKQGLFGKTDSFRSAIEKLSKDGLKSFDEEVFQNKEKFMEAYNIDMGTYDDLEKIMKARRKAFDAQDKREIKSQDYFTLSRLSAISDAELADVETRDSVTPETIEMIKKAKKAAQKAGASESAAYNFGDQNEGFLAAIMEMQDVVTSKDDGSPEYADKLLQSAAKVDNTLTKMFNAGLSEDATQLLRRGLTESISSQDFAAVLDTSDSSFISELTRGAYNDFDTRMSQKESEIRKKYGSNLNPFQERQMAEELRNIPTRTGSRVNVGQGYEMSLPEISENTKKALKAYASEVYNVAMIQAAQGDYEGAMQTRADGNRELIYMKYGQWIPRHQFANLESELKAGRKAYITIGNSQYEYLGVSQNDIIVKGRF
ncbi:MAG: hypothetical protein MJ197_07655 [Bacteroidales bacterium]|nr:hypothetical protein [Bacteroidales bacterium]